MNIAQTDAGSAVALLEIVAALNEGLIQLAQRLRKDPGVLSVIRGADIRRYAERLTVETFVDVEMKDGQAYSYWVEVWRGSNSWNLSASLNRSVDGGQQTVSEFSSAENESLEHLHIEMDKLLITLTIARLPGASVPR